MPSAFHLGPWLLGTVKNTKGTTAGTIRNVGATLAAQTVLVPSYNSPNYTTPTGMWLPAGASLLSGSITSVGGSYFTSCEYTQPEINIATSQAFNIKNTVTPFTGSNYTQVGSPQLDGGGSMSVNEPSWIGFAQNIIQVFNVSYYLKTNVQIFFRAATDSSIPPYFRINLVYAVNDPSGSYTPSYLTGP
jgi:hypothetical protein